MQSADVEGIFNQYGDAADPMTSHSSGRIDWDDLMEEGASMSIISALSMSSMSVLPFVDGAVSSSEEEEEEDRKGSNNATNSHANQQGEAGTESVVGAPATADNKVVEATDDLLTPCASPQSSGSGNNSNSRRAVAMSGVPREPLQELGAHYISNYMEQQEQQQRMHGKQLEKGSETREESECERERLYHRLKQRYIALKAEQRSTEQEVLLLKGTAREGERANEQLRRGWSTMEGLNQMLAERCRTLLQENEELLAASAAGGKIEEEEGVPTFQSPAMRTSSGAEKRCNQRTECAPGEQLEQQQLESQQLESQQLEEPSLSPTDGSSRHCNGQSYNSIKTRPTPRVLPLCGNQLEHHPQKAGSWDEEDTSAMPSSPCLASRITMAEVKARKEKGSEQVRSDQKPGFRGFGALPPVLKRGRVRRSPRKAKQRPAATFDWGVQPKAGTAAHDSLVALTSQPGFNRDDLL
jgi:hypothetical protein